MIKLFQLKDGSKLEMTYICCDWTMHFSQNNYESPKMILEKNF